MAVYESGMYLRELDGMAYHDIERGKLKEFWVLNFGQPFLKIDIQDGRQLIWRRRYKMTNGVRSDIATIVGYHEGGEFSLLYIYPNGVIELSDSKDNIVLHEYEE